MSDFSHIEDDKVRMVDIGEKEIVERRSIATGKIRLKKETIKKIKNNKIEKGNVLATARISGIQAVKRTWDSIPLCHQIPINSVTIDFDFEEAYLKTEVEVKSNSKTGVEMEALNGVSNALLTVWDMVKSLEKNEKGQYPETRINDIKVEKKIKEEK